MLLLIVCFDWKNIEYLQVQNNCHFCKLLESGRVEKDNQLLFISLKCFVDSYLLIVTNNFTTFGSFHPILSALTELGHFSISLFQSTAEKGIVLAWRLFWFGLVWFGVAWLGLDWFGLVLAMGRTLHMSRNEVDSKIYSFAITGNVWMDSLNSSDMFLGTMWDSVETSIRSSSFFYPKN